MAANDGFHRRMWYQLTQLVAEYRNRSTTVYLGPPGRAVQQQPAPELSETVTQYTTLIVLKFLSSTPSLPSQASQSTSFPPRPHSLPPSLPGLTVYL